MVPIFATMVSTYLFCFSILGLYDEVVLSIITCVQVDLEQHNGKVKYGTPELHKLMKKVYACHDLEKEKYISKNDKRLR